MVKMTGLIRRTKDKMWVSLRRQIHSCNTVTIQTVIWVLILICLTGSVYLNVTLEQAARLARARMEVAKMDAIVLQTELPTSKRPSAVTQKPTPLRPAIKIPLVKKTKPKPKPNAPPPIPKKPTKKNYLVHWYNPPPYLKLKPDAFSRDFKQCKYNNCELNFERKNATKSDAVLFDGRWVFERVGFERPPGQVWVFAAHEPPAAYMELGGWWTKEPWRTAFNWTMTYNKENTDIYLPYGELQPRLNPQKRDWQGIARKKTKGALYISSHCDTNGKREKYVQMLQKYIDVDVLGKCGTPWNCGTHYIHDDCFQLLNTTYKFFLSFENSLCQRYISEKFYENFAFDVIQVVRGGNYQESTSILPKGTFISTDSFKTIEGLGKFLQRLSWNLPEYAHMLENKSKYYYPGYTPLYQRALCDVCERMNNQEKYKKHYPDIVKWAYKGPPCRNATDLV